MKRKVNAYMSLAELRTIERNPSRLALVGIGWSRFRRQAVTITIDSIKRKKAR